MNRTLTMSIPSARICVARCLQKASKNAPVLGPTITIERPCKAIDKACSFGSKIQPATEKKAYTEQNRVIVFESNAGVLGKIGDDELRAKVIKVYGVVKGLIDTLNADAREFAHWRALPDGYLEKKIVAGMLAQIEGGLRHGLADLQRELDEVLKQIETYLTR